VRGLTTAAGIWTTAAIGMTVGLGRETTAVISTVLVLVILSLLLRLERRMTRRKEERGEISPGERRARERDS
jgi:putative Mg2+ transporter-C (MgtC) family protein